MGRSQSKNCVIPISEENDEYDVEFDRMREANLKTLFCSYFRRE